MAIYVDINSTYTGSNHSGTASDPMSWAQWLAITPKSGTYYFRGVRSTGDSISNGTNSYQIDAWDLKLYGPWKLVVNDADSINAIYSNGYLSVSSTTIFKFFSLTNAFVVVNNSATINMSGNGSIVSSTYKCGTITCLGATTITNSIINASITLPYNNVLVVTNTLTDKSGPSTFVLGPGDITLSSVTYNWSPPAYPTYSDPELYNFNLSDGFGVGYTTGWAHLAPVRKYVLLSTAYTSAGHAGTISDPWSFTDFSAGIRDNGIYFFKGQYTLSTDFTSTKIFSMRAWDVGQHGPWRIRGSTNYFSAVSASLYDGYLEGTNVSYLNATRMYIYTSANTGTNAVSASGTVSQTTLSYKQVLTISSGTVTMDNVIFWGIDAADNISVALGATLNIDTCYTNRSNRADLFTISGTVNDTNITYSQVFSSIPVWTSTDLRNFNLNSLGVGVASENNWASGKNFYVGLSETTTGNSGTYGDQRIGWTELLTKLGTVLSAGTIFYCAGQRTLSANLTYTSSAISFKAWNKAVYGPWRIKTSTYTVNIPYISLYDGIIDTTGSSSAIMSSLRGCYVIGGSGDIPILVGYAATSSATIDKTTFVLAGRLDIDTPPTGPRTYTFTNSIFYTSGGGVFLNAEADITANITNCITNKADLASFTDNPPDVNATNLTYGWTPPVSLPAWDAIDLYTFKLEGSPTAVSYGCQEFPTILYSDIAITNDSSEYSGEDPNNPASFYTVYYLLPTLSRSYIYFKGYRDMIYEIDYDINNLSFPYASTSIYAWDKSIYGPWKIKSTFISNKGINLIDGIIYSTDYLSIYGIHEQYTGTVSYENTFFDAGLGVIVGSGTKDIKGCTNISNTTAISFTEELPDNTAYSTYITDNFQDGTENSWWNSEFRTGPNAFEIEQFPPGLGNYVAVQNSSVDIRLTPVGISLTGNFELEMEIIFGETQTGNVSEHISVYDANTSAQILDYYWIGDYLTFNGSSVYLPASSYGSIFIKLVRVGTNILAYYSVFNNTNSWTLHPGSAVSYSGPFYIGVNGADDNGIGEFRFSAEGNVPGDTQSFPYGKVDNESVLENSVIDTPSINTGLWEYNTIDINSCVFSTSQWVGTGITHSGDNQYSWTKATAWPEWSEAESNNKDAYNYGLWNSNITIPGDSSLWLSYPEGLWGEPRLGVGAFYFGFLLNFSGDPTLAYFSPGNPDRVQFTVTNDTGATSWRWDFGDGESILITDPLQKNVAHDYTVEGVYTVSLMLNENPGLKLTKYGYIVCLRVLDLTIVHNPASYYGSIPATFQFGVANATRPLDNEVASGYNGFYWNYGDFGFSYGLTGPSHLYISYGAFPVALTVRDVGVSGLDITKQLTTFTTSVSLLNLLIQVEPNLGLLPLPVSFTVTSAPGSYEPVTWRWIFRDSSESNTKNTSHTYTVAGTYDVVLITDEGLITQQIFSSDPLYPGVTIVVPDMQVIASGLNADFDVIPPHGYSPFTGLFDGSLTQGSVTGWEWDFNDGSSHVFGVTAPIHSYGTINIYNPTLTAYDIYGLTSTKTKSVEVLPDLDIDISFDTTYVPNNATFTPVNDDFAVEWDWELIYTDSVLGDIVLGRKNASTEIDKIYEAGIDAPTTYKIRLTITDDFSETYTVIKTFSVPENIVIVTNPSPATGNLPLTIDFAATGGVYSTVSTWEWDFTGDGIYEATTETATYTYLVEDNYTAYLHLVWRLQDIDDPGKSSAFSLDKQVHISAVPSVLSVRIEATPTIGQKDLEVNFVGIANNPIVSWDWELEGVGNIGTTQEINYTFTAIGSYVVTLTVIDSFGNGPLSTNVTIRVFSGISTPDEALGDDVYLSLEGSGTVTTPIGNGVSLRIPIYETNPTPFGFTRRFGPTIIFD